MLQIINSQRDNDELKYYEDVYTSEDNITIDGKQLPSFTIVENTYYTGETNNNYRVNARIGCALGNAEGMKRFVSVTCLLYTSPSPRDLSTSRMPSSA